MKRCLKCLMADTKPGVILDGKGVCPACNNHAKRSCINYVDRRKELSELCCKYKGYTFYDCVIPCSGGKDSWWQVYIIKQVMGMNPLLVTVGDHYEQTWEGKQNFDKMCEYFDCDSVVGTMGKQTAQTLTRIAFEEFGSPTWPIDRAIYCWPLQVALEKEIPLVIYGENTAYEYGGVRAMDSEDANLQIHNDVVKDVPQSLWRDIPDSKMNMLNLPQDDDLRAVYLSYYMPWSGWDNYQYAKTVGFEPLYDKRDGFVENYDQITSKGYLFNVYMKYVKYGFGRVTDVVGYWLRDGLITLNRAKKLIEQEDHKLDWGVYSDFRSFIGYTDKQMYAAIEKHRGPAVDLKGYPQCLNENRPTCVSSVRDETLPG